MALSTLPDDTKNSTEPNESDEFFNNVYGNAGAKNLNDAERNPDSPTSKEKGVSDQEASPEGAGAGFKNNFTGKKGSGKTNFFKKKGRGPLVSILLTLLAGGGGIGLFVGPAMAPIAFFENITDDLNDQLAALDMRSGFVFRNKLPSAERKVALTGCTTLSIRCKFASINERQVAKLKQAGIEVSPTAKGGLFGTRIQPTNYKFQGKDYSPEKWAQELKTNSHAANAQRRANNMKYLGMSDTAFTRVLTRFGISKRPPELKGTAKERVAALMNKAGTSDSRSLTLKPAIDAEGNAMAAPDGTKPAFVLDGDSKGTVYNEADRAKMQKSIDRVANAKPPSGATKASLGALSVLGYWDLACSIKNMVGGASIAAKVANQTELIQYAMPIAALSSQMKAGDISAENAEALGEFFTQTDTRKLIVDLEQSATGSSNEGTTISDELATIPNPNLGKNGMDSELYKMSTLGGVAAPSTSRTMFSLGMSQNSLLAGISGFAAIANTLTNVGDAKACGIVQNFGVRLVGGAIAVVAAVGSGGGTIAIQAGIAGGMIAAMMVLDTIIHNALDSSLIENADLGSAPVDRVDAVWTGKSGILGAAAQHRGLVPGTTDEIIEYAQLQNNTKQDYIALETEDAHPLDVSNQYSFMGSLARSVAGYTSSSSFGVSSLFHNVSSIVSGGVNSLSRVSSVYATSLNPDRFKQCDDESYLAIGINADVQCNIRYIMPTADLQLDTDDVAVYMEQNNYVEKDTITGLPVGYTAPDPAESQNAVMDVVSGAVDSIINTRPLNDYGKFLDYCAYRTQPFGETFEETGSLSDDELEWKTGKKCMEKSEMLSNFRIYTLDKTVQDAQDSELPTAAPAATTAPSSPQAAGTPDNVTTRGAGWTLTDNLDYSAIPCAPGAPDVGTYTHPINGFTIRKCAFAGDQVASIVSEKAVAMFAAAKAAGVTLSLASGFRSYEEQAALYAQNCNSAGLCSPDTAKPGNSQHEAGLALDIEYNGSTICYKRSAANCQGNAGFDWLKSNASNYGFINYPKEAWHWGTS